MTAQWLRRTSAALAGLVLASTALAAGDRDDCALRQGERSVAACTRLITSGALGSRDLATMHALRGATYRNAGEYDRAISDFTKAIEHLEKTEPADVVASAYVARGSARTLKGDLEGALADYQKAIALDSKNDQALEGRKRVEAALAAPMPAPSVDLLAAIAVPNEPLPAEIAISPEVLRLVESHPFFANPPPVSLRAYDSDSNSHSTINGVSVQTSSNMRSNVAWLRRGIISETTVQETTQTNTGSPRNTIRVTSVSAANGIISLGYKSTGSMKTSLGPTTSQSTGRLLRIDNIVGTMFPMKVRNRFSYRELRQSTTSTRGATTFIGHDEFTQDNDCEVSNEYDAKIFHPKLSGSAFLLNCREQVIYKTNAAYNRKGESKTIFFEMLGTSIRVDSAFPRQHIVQTYFQGGTTEMSILKSITTAQ